MPREPPPGSSARSPRPLQLLNMRAALSWRAVPARNSGGANHRRAAFEAHFPACSRASAARRRPALFCISSQCRHPRRSFLLGAPYGLEHRLTGRPGRAVMRPAGRAGKAVPFQLGDHAKGGVLNQVNKTGLLTYKAEIDGARIPENYRVPVFGAAVLCHAPYYKGKWAIGCRIAGGRMSGGRRKGKTNNAQQD